MASAPMRDDSRACKRCGTAPITGYKFCSDCDPWKPKGLKRGRKPIDLTGRRFGRLVCTAITEDRKDNKAVWLVDCDCGVKGKPIVGNYLLSRNVKSCGCIRSEASRQRGIDRKGIKQRRQNCVCVSCGQIFQGTRRGRFCSQPCRTSFNTRNIVRPSLSCDACSSTFEKKHPNNRFCSNSCRKRVYDAERNPLRWQVLRLGKVDPIQVFERDKWRCQLCGVMTRKDLRGKYDPRSPELDHIIPLSRGGEHSYRNTQCACRQCNGAKSNKIIGQMRLFG